MRVYLQGLGDRVGSLVIVMSCWANNPLSDVEQPLVQVRDCSNVVMFCFYHVEVSFQPRKPQDKL